MSGLRSWAGRHVVGGLVGIVLAILLLASSFDHLVQTSGRNQTLTMVPNRPEVSSTSSTVGRRQPARTSDNSPTSAAARAIAQGHSAVVPPVSVRGAAGPATASAPADIPFLAGVPVGVPAGDYLLRVTGVSAPGNVVGRIEQTTLGGGLPLRVAEFHASPSPSTVVAEVRVIGSLDTFSLASESAAISSSQMTLAPASWSYLARGQQITTTGASDVLLHGINGVEMAGPTRMATTFATYPAVSVVRLVIDEGCWDPYFTAAQASKKCNAYDAKGRTASASYRAWMTSIVRSIVSGGRAVILLVNNSLRDDPNFVVRTETDVVAPDQHTLGVYDDLAAAFGRDPHVMFETFNEPKMKPDEAYPPDNLFGANLWRDGGPMTIDGITWHAPGVQQTVDHIRAKSANLIMVEGLTWGEDLTPVMSDPVDGTNLVYSYHAYNPGSTTVAPSLNTNVAPLFDPRGKFRYAGFLSEFGTVLQDGQGSEFLTSAMRWAQAHHTGWAAWGWFPNAWDSYGLLTSYSPMGVTPKGQTVIAGL